MKARGTRGGILLSLTADDTVETIAATLEPQRELLAGRVIVEIAEKVAFPVLAAIDAAVRDAGGELTDVRPPSSVMALRGETVIVARTIRGGGRIDSTGSIVVLGDVNAGAELVANDDVIVTGVLRGLPHAGAAGNEKAVIYAERILSPQLRIAGELAQSGGRGVDGAPDRKGPEVALLREGQIVVRPWGS
ncbi:septum site-determining protein MinC [soil metagenome]|nr:septum site-determining protein MinC [Trueperaceae bacterium]